MPRHVPDNPPSDEPGPAGRRLYSAVRSGDGTGLLREPPLVSPAEEQGTADDPPGRRGPRIRWRTGRQAAALLCLASMALLGWFWWQAANVTEAVSPLSSVNDAGEAAEAAEADETPAPEPDTGPTPAAEFSHGGNGGVAPGRIIVHVAGAVFRSGIVELPQGSRLHEAIAAAGGGAPDADPDQLNLAAVLADGEKVLVPRQGETVQPGIPPTGDGARGSPTGAGGTPPATGKTNLNTAGLEELATLPRVGPVLAQRIVEWRTQHGHFQRIEELDAVDGFGPKLLEVLLPLVRV